MPLSSAGHRSVLGRASFVAILGLLLAFSGCRKPGGKSQTPLESRVDLLAALEKAEVRTPDGHPDYVARWKQKVSGEERDVVFMHPSSRATFPPLRMTLESRLELSFGINEQVWEKEGDGVRFSVFAVPADETEVRVFSTYLDPKHEVGDRRWVDAVVNLGTYAGRDVAVILQTETGPAGDFRFDWAGWSRALLFLDK